jgi:hypothetical protein
MTFDRQPPLRTCDACARHVFATETACPFCAAVLAPMAARPRFKLHIRLSRAQRFALAGAVAGLIGCSDSGPRLEPPYGAPFPRDGGTDGANRGGTGGHDGGAGGSGEAPDEDAGAGDAGDIDQDAGHW